MSGIRWLGTLRVQGLNCPSLLPRSVCPPPARPVRPPSGDERKRERRGRGARVHDDQNYFTKCCTECMLMPITEQG